MVKNYSEYICFFIILFFSIFFIENLDGIINIKSGIDGQFGYVDISERWFKSEAIIYRPLGYPIFIYFLKFWHAVCFTIYCVGN